MGQLAAESALKDAGVDYPCVQAVAASYCYGDPTSGKNRIKCLGLQGNNHVKTVESII